MLTYENIQKFATGQGDDYTTGWLLHYPYFKDDYKMIAIDLNKQQGFDADPKSIQQINFIGNVYPTESATMFFIIEVFFTKKRERTVILFWFNIILE